MVYATVYGLPEHNPEPSTERGRRRHARRSEQGKNHAKSAWESGRMSAIKLGQPYREARRPNMSRRPWLVEQKGS